MGVRGRRVSRLIPPSFWHDSSKLVEDRVVAFSPEREDWKWQRLVLFSVFEGGGQELVWDT